MSSKDSEHSEHSEHSGDRTSTCSLTPRSRRCFMLDALGAGGAGRLMCSVPHNVQLRSKYPPVSCDFNALGWSGRPDDNCIYVLDQARLGELGARPGIAMTLHVLSAEKLEAVKHDCEIIVRLANQVFERQIGYDEASIKWLAWLIEFSRNKPQEQVKKNLQTSIGCFLGEACG